MSDYYSALDKTDTSLSYEQVKRFEINGSVAFVYDIENGKLPKEYDECDVFYTEIPWDKGYEVFNKRADKKGGSYSKFVASLTNIIQSVTYDKPLVIVAGKHLYSHIPVPSGVAYGVEFNGYPSMAYFYGIDIRDNIKVGSNEKIIEALSNEFNRVGDFCCGYGNVGKSFYKKGKSFVMSDINPRCIGYIKENIKKWEN